MTVLSLDRIRRWFRYAVEYAFASGIGQVLGMAAGLIYVRVLSVEQYSLYGLVMTTIIFLNLASDIGLNQSINYFWRHARSEGKKFGAYLDQIRRARWWLLASGGSIGVIGLLYATREYDLGWLERAGAILIVLFSVMAMLETAIADALFKLEARYRRSYLNNLVGQIGRFVVAALMLVMLPATAIWAALGSLFGALLTFFATRVGNPVRVHSAATGDGHTMPDRPGRTVIRYVLPMAPNVLVFAMQETIIYWMASARGGQQVMAEVFALGRINALLAVGSGFLIAVVMPRLANVGDGRIFARYYWFLQLCAAIMGAVLIALSVWMPQPFLWIIGDNYSGLGNVLPLMITSFVFAVMMSIAGLANRLRGWIRPEPLIALAQLGAILAVIFFFPFDSAVSVAGIFVLLNLLSALLMIAVSVAGHRWPALVTGRAVS